MVAFDDDAFGRDPFEELVRDFFGGSRRVNRENFISSEEDERNTDFVEDEDYVYLIFELPGYNEKDVSVAVSGNTLEIKALKKESVCDSEKVQGYLISKLCRGVAIRKTLPKFVSPKNFKHSMRNGTLEVVFSKK